MLALDIEIAIMQSYDVRLNIIVPNVSWGLAGLHECDVLILTKHGYATEIEIKVSKADIIADKRKRHQHRHNHIKHLLFAVPYELREFALEHIPERAGLLLVGKEQRIKIERKSTTNPNAVKWTNNEILHLAHLGTMRILKLKEKIQSLQKR